MNIGTVSKPPPSPRPARRAYASALREQQAGQTRETILRTLADLIRSGEMEDLSYPLLAERSGVSVPTLYRYFPSRKALFDGLFAWLEVTLRNPGYPRELQEMIAKTPALFDYYHRNRDLLRTARAAKLLREVGEEGQRARDRRFSLLLEPRTRHLPPERANAFHAMFRLLYSFDGYTMMQERFGVGPAEASDTVVWAMRALLDRLEQDARQVREDEVPGKKRARPRKGKEPRK